MTAQDEHIEKITEATRLAKILGGSFAWGPYGSPSVMFTVAEAHGIEKVLAGTGAAKAMMRVQALSAGVLDLTAISRELVGMIAVIVSTMPDANRAQLNADLEEIIERINTITANVSEAI